MGWMFTLSCLVPVAVAALLQGEGDTGSSPGEGQEVLAMDEGPQQGGQLRCGREEGPGSPQQGGQLAALPQGGEDHRHRGVGGHLCGGIGVWGYT